MQQQQQQYGAPPPSDMAQFGSPAAVPYAHQNPMAAEAAAPISSRPPGPACPNYDIVMAGNFPDDDAAAAGDEIERGGVSGNRWPRQETLALLKIRSEMDAAFRDATLKGPLWDDVSRKLAELGHMRSAKKCKEKFENVHKYYKRTKEGRAGRQDGKSYRFFTQLEALHSATTTTTTTVPSASAAAAPMTNPAIAISVPSPVTPVCAVYTAPQVSMPQQSPVMPLPPMPARAAVPDPAPVAVQPRAPASFSGLAPGPSFSSDTFSSSSDENEEDGGGGRSRDSRKRKRGSAGLGSGEGGNRKMMAFFEGLMKQVVERQEAMQQRFLETIEKREQDRMIREEAWRRQEMARLNREHELMAQDRATAASRDAAVISFLQKISGQSIQLPPAVVTIQPPSQLPMPQPQQQHPPPKSPPQPLPQQSKSPPAQQPQQLKQQEHHNLQNQTMEVVRHQPPPSSSTELIPIPSSEPRESAAGGFEVGSPSRWPKSEVHALIKLRSGLEMRYQESGPKGPLWEEISAGMQRLGYNRNSKRCKEKWENINKYFKKVKESNKKRPEDAKTCPYFHQLDALYRQKLLISNTTEAAGFGGGQKAQEQQETTHTPNIKPLEQGDTLITKVPPLATQLPHQDANKKNGDGGGGGGGTNPQQMQPSNGGLPSSFFQGGTSSEALKKPEDIVKELMDHRHQQAPIDHNYNKLVEHESDSMDDDDDDDDDDEDDDGGKMQYRIQFQRPNMGGGGGDGNTSAKPTTAAAQTTTAGSFLGIVQ